MLFGDLAPFVRPLSRWLATAGWFCTLVGLGAGLIVAVGTGVSLSPSMQAIQTASLVATAAAALLIGSAAASQPVAERDDEAPEPWFYPAAAAQVRSFLLGSIVMLLGLLGFAMAGLFMPSGPSPQSIAFSQIFLLGSVSCGLTFLLLNRILPIAERRTR
ncbi:hypothetical protein SAMN04487917_101422 [Arthrobacter sp. yr096]|uniref:hypothetical protein n=1 Tax=unclassified Arthrobacter TaxID=235627 RepID=UPI000899925C|nr:MULTISPECIES: hypothetical protein [unclassified Arthrobacter]SDX20771.1 hypothetical protein SAMN04487912_108197 [Arthrobacter sp. cf158]SEI46220.1 hypothetical protein SAMN04487917_101422 [Arthrobacter sp. yr096]